MLNTTRTTSSPALIVAAAILAFGLSPVGVVAAAVQYTNVEAAPPTSVRSHTAYLRPVVAPDPITVAPAGDSITAWADGVTWPAYMDPADDIQIVPGFAAGGQKIGFIAANTPNCGCDIVVVMAGTNDLGDQWGTPMGERSESLVQIVVASGAAHALILAVPPINIDGSWVTVWNTEQQRLAAFYGWDYFDPWASIRTPENTYVAGANFDHAHPTPESQQDAAVLIREAILAAVR